MSRITTNHTCNFCNRKARRKQYLEQYCCEYHYIRLRMRNDEEFRIQYDSYNIKYQHSKKGQTTIKKAMLNRKQRMAIDKEYKQKVYDGMRKWRANNKHKLKEYQKNFVRKHGFKTGGSGVVSTFLDRYRHNKAWQKEGLEYTASIYLDTVEGIIKNKQETLSRIITRAKAELPQRILTTHHGGANNEKTKKETKTSKGETNQHSET